MEAILPGSGENLRRFSKQGSLHQTMPRPENPYSLAGSEATDYSSANYPEQSMEERTSTSSQPLDYIDPIRMRELNGRIQNNSHGPVGAQDTSHSPVGVQSDCIRGRPYQYNNHSGVGAQTECVRERPPVSGLPNLSHSADSKPLRKGLQQTNSRQTHNRSTFTHGERDHQLLQLSRSLTDQDMNKSPEHHYELDVMDVIQQSKPPVPDRPPPTAKPRGAKQRPPPRLRNGSSSSDSQSVSSPKDVDEHFHSHGHVDKEAEYDIPVQPPQPTPRRQVTTIPGDSPQSIVKSKPPITPRRNAAKPVKQSEYLHLVDNCDAGTNGSTTAYDTPRSPPVAAPPVLSEEIVQNFTPGQLDMLIKMLQQVQGSGGHQPLVTSPQVRTQGSAVAMDNGQMKKQFGKLAN